MNKPHQTHTPPTQTQTHTANQSTQYQTLDGTCRKFPHRFSFPFSVSFLLSSPSWVLSKSTVFPLSSPAFENQPAAPSLPLCLALEGYLLSSCDKNTWGVRNRHLLRGGL